MLKNNEKVAKFKVIARDALRSELVSSRLSRIASIETEIKNVEEYKKEKELDLTTEKYEISKLDTEHPKYDKEKAYKEETVTHLTKSVEDQVEVLKKLEDDKKEQTEAITKIETGETKVSLERLNDLVQDMIKQDALNAVATVKEDK